ncbi:uncharacterized protein K452DRAFT_291833 [Aplosporella prunicola CBS 121167]|uniref:Protein kinase domain-containing protein n=1 Tax=Aplosporella prunicola CBS 121167 TaxID=1176127 RepID=A0A6A6AZG3_9PEZI|nr:uncharacterized protein K452DRAFT_291833 [Aplosporella prunicola CBS 121167]KAF2137170.1 hypothetical protein K452DRAFT_291833 [Aplosporella prunicola CBS 121167]
MQASQFLPGWSTSPQNAQPKHPFLHQTMSVSNFRAEDRSPWEWPRSPPSPSASSSSSASRSMTPTSSNPWANSVGPLVSSVSSDSPPRFLPSCPTPPSMSRSITPSSSRCTTPTAPVAPKPLNATKPPGFINITSPMMSPVSPNGDKQMRDTSGFPTPAPNPFRESVGFVSLSPLATAIITPALEKQYVHRESPTLISRQGWERSTGQRAYTWALGNSKTALLFLMCDDIAAWRRASFYWLEDSKMPFTEADLEGIATNPKKVVDNQWRVLTRELPQNGSHIDFQPREIIPLQSLGSLSNGPENPRKTLDRVRWRGEDSGRFYVRKRFTFDRQAEKLGLLSQIQRIRTLEHPNIAKIVCSYSQGASVAFVTAQAQFSLEEYLQHPLASTRPTLLLTWIHDLTQALAYIHTTDLLHASIRPSKILIDKNGTRAFFSAFGIAIEPSTSSPRGGSNSPRGGSNSPHGSGHGNTLSTLSNSQIASAMRPLSEAAYIYAAPEVIQRHRHRYSTDIFSLGCVFLEMLTVAKGQTVSNCRAYRAHFSQDPSFHANLERVGSWRKLLMQLNSRGTTGTAGIGGSKREDEVTEYQALGFVGAMIHAESSKRLKMRQLAPHVSRWNEARTVHRRRSFDGGDAATGGTGSLRWASATDKQGLTQGSLISF